MERYNHQKIEAKWAKIWEKNKTWRVDLAKAKKPYYNLMMFPYPSAEGLHVGNVYAFVGSDIHGRFERMRGNDVFEPMGFDSFGIHSENFAIKQGTHPKEQTAKNIKNFTKQFKQLGNLFDWDHTVTTSEPEYYKWTQWLFLELYKAGLAYKQKAPVEWCPSCKTVLANEQVIDGKCERCDTEVIQKELEQWFFRITKYADRLLKNLEWIDWSEKTKIAQRNWIGRSEGAALTFPIVNSKLEIEVFTTRPDTLFGSTYMVLAPEHPLVVKMQDEITNIKEVKDYQEKSKEKTELERIELAEEKTGVELKGIKAINPANKAEIPVWIADYVLASYGTGAIMAVPAHDERDFEFAKKFNLDIRPVIDPKGTKPVGRMLVSLAEKEKKIEPTLKRLERIQSGDESYTGNGWLINSGKFDGTASEKAKAEIVRFVKGKKTVKYHLRDWLISRQRYWGPPIPIIYCKKCGTVPVPEKDLPVKLPEVKDFRPTGTGKSPLASVASFVKTKCPTCNGSAERETDVSDNFLDSSWYFLRYPSAEFEAKPFDTARTKKWLPVNMYIGGHEHAVLHLLYTRFITMALKDMGHIAFEEPFLKFRAHGLITKDGKKMSKSKGNVVNPDTYFKKYGADTVRTYLMFIGPLAEGGDWSDRGIVGISRFFNRLWVFVPKLGLGAPKPSLGKDNSKLEVARNRTIKKVTEDLEGLRYNTAIAALMEYSNGFIKNPPTKEEFNTLLMLLSPFAPHLTEELWEKLGNKESVHNQPWPTYNPKILEEKVIRLVIQVNGKVRDVLEVSSGILEKDAIALALAQEKIKKWFPTGKPKNVVFVKGRLLNLVSY